MIELTLHITEHPISGYIYFTTCSGEQVELLVEFSPAIQEKCLSAKQLVNAPPKETIALPEYNW